MVSLKATSEPRLKPIYWL